MAEPIENPKAFKSQPWTLYDTVVARSFLMGDGTAAGLAVGSQQPAVSSAGEIQFFGPSARTSQNMPWYSNQDNPGLLSYGLQVWQIYVAIMFPVVYQQATVNPQQASPIDPLLGAIPGVMKLAEAILNFSALHLELGQEQQTQWPLSRFGAGGGLQINGLAGVAQINNGWAVSTNVLKLPEPIEMARTTNMSAKIRIAPEVFGLIGNTTTPGVGSPLLNYNYDTQGDNTAPFASLQQQPFAIQLGLTGRRIKQSQYGQLVRNG